MIDLSKNIHICRDGYKVGVGQDRWIDRYKAKSIDRHVESDQMIFRTRSIFTLNSGVKSSLTFQENISCASRGMWVAVKEFCSRASFSVLARSIILYQHAHWNCQKTIWRKWLEVFICTHTLFECFGILYLLTIRAARCKRLILMSFPSWHSTRPRFVRKSRLPKRYTKRYLRFRFARHPSFSTVYNNLRVNHLCLKNIISVLNMQMFATTNTFLLLYKRYIITFPFCQTFFFQHCLQQPPGKSSLFKEIRRPLCLAWGGGAREAWSMDCLPASSRATVAGQLQWQHRIFSQPVHGARSTSACQLVASPHTLSTPYRFCFAFSGFEAAVRRHVRERIRDPLGLNPAGVPLFRNHASNPTK